MIEKKGKKHWIVIGIVVILAIIVGVIVLNSKNDTAEGPGGSVQKKKKRNIANSISGNGVIESANTQEVTGGSYGMKVSEVLVSEGDTVAKGDVICVFDTTDIEDQIADLNSRINELEADRDSQNADYDQQMVDADADRAEDLANAQANLAEAEADLAGAEADLAQKKAEYEAYLNDDDPTHTSTTLEAIQMQAVIETKENNVETIRMRVENYQTQVENYSEGDNSYIEDAKENYNNQMDNSIESLEDQLERYQNQKDDAVIVAGMDGTITAVNVVEDSTFSGGAIAIIEGVDQFIVEAQIEEYDIADVQVGMKVLIKTDATRDEELEGVISYIAPRATNSGSSGAFSSLMGGVDASSMTGGSGSATYLVKIGLNEQNSRLRLGMNAKTSIITEERVDVWAVPYDAGYAREDGTAYLKEVTGKDEEGNLIMNELDVKIGLQGTYYVEVVSELINENTEIFIPDAQGNSSIEELLNMMGADAGI